MENLEFPTYEKKGTNDSMNQFGSNKIKRIYISKEEWRKMFFDFGKELTFN